MLTITPQDEKFLRKLGARLRQIREEKGWTLEDTEDHGYSSWRHLQRIETGNKNVTILSLWRLASVYGTTLEEMLSFK
jgi:transcriptional regulator with XRE-family HTH domain